MAAPSPAEIQYQLEHIHDDTSSQIISAFAICLGFAIVAVLLRFLARHIMRAPLCADDWTIVAGLICAIGYVAGQAVCIPYGLGKHAVRVTGPIEISRAMHASSILYIASLSLTKISILLLYRRIFPNRGFNANLWAVGGFIAAFTTANILSLLFQCIPVKAGYNPFIRGQCIDIEAAILAAAVLTIITDFVILFLPLPLVWKLHLPKVKKVQVSLVFLLGALTSIVSIYRATQVNKVTQSDLSYTSTKRSIWSGVEICTAIVCANLPILRHILEYLLTGKFMSTARSGTASKTTTSALGRSFRHRWAWRHAAPATSETSKDNPFHRLEPHPGAIGTDDVERQKYEGYTMYPIHSPRTPEIAHL